MIEKLLSKLNTNTVDLESIGNDLILNVFFEGDSEKHNSKVKEIDTYYLNKKLNAQEKTSKEQLSEIHNLVGDEKFNGFVRVDKGVAFYIDNKELKMLLGELYHAYNFLFHMTSTFSEVSNISNFISSFQSNKIELGVLFKKIPKEQQLRFLNYYEDNKTKLESILTKVFKIKKIDKIILNKLFTTSKSKISKEFLIDKKTLNKWLEHSFGNRFDDKKSLYLTEYIEIYNSFLDEPKEYLDIIDFEKINGRNKEGMNFNKTFIAFLTNNDSNYDKSTLLKSQKNSLKKFSIYNSINKFPYSLIRKFVHKLGDKDDLPF